MPLYKQIPRSRPQTSGFDVPSANRVVSWIMARWRLLSIIAGSVIVLVLLILGVQSIQGMKERRAARQYAALAPSGEARQSGLETLAEEYPRTMAGIRVRFELGREAFNEKRYDEALAWYQPLTKLSDERGLIRILARHNLATIYEAQEKWSEAMVQYKAAAADPVNITRAYTYYHMGRVSQKMGMTDEARLWFEQSQELAAGMPLGQLATERILWLSIDSSESQ